MTYVNRFDQRGLAWSLVDVAAQHLVPDDRAWLCVKIGAGDVERALITLVGTCMRHEVALPADVEATLRDWLRGYSGTELSAAFESYIGRTGRDGAVTDVGFAADRMLGGRGQFKNRPRRVPVGPTATGATHDSESKRIGQYQ